jgi:RNase P/RNase MRP subunit POP5
VTEGKKTMTRDEALRLAQYALHHSVTMELPRDSGTIRKIADAIMQAYKCGREYGGES